jgi:predicted hotdog family 3-hydroxylacyl-ACP dehydratase
LREGVREPLQKRTDEKNMYSNLFSLLITNNRSIGSEEEKGSFKCVARNETRKDVSLKEQMFSVSRGYKESKLIRKSGP